MKREIKIRSHQPVLLRAAEIGHLAHQTLQIVDIRRLHMVAPQAHGQALKVAAHKIKLIGIAQPEHRHDRTAIAVDLYEPFLLEQT